MTTKQLSFKAPPTLAVALNATTPNPGAANAGALVWSSLTNGLLVWNGASWGSAGAGALTTVTLDVGPIPQLETIFDVTDSSVKLTSLVSAAVVGVGAGRDSDEMEFDKPQIAAWVIAAGSIRFQINGLIGPVHDAYRVAYSIL